MGDDRIGEMKLILTCNVLIFLRRINIHILPKNIKIKIKIFKINNKKDTQKRLKKQHIILSLSRLLTDNNPSPLTISNGEVIKPLNKLGFLCSITFHSLLLETTLSGL